MAVASVDKDDKGIDFIDLPFIDLRHFGGDELRLVAQFSGHFPEASFSDIVVPKIDRSCFNESAGSRRQTWTNRASSNKHSNRSTLGSSGAAITAVIERRSFGLTKTSVHIHNTDALIMPDAGTRSRTAKAVPRLTSNGKVTVTSSAREVAWKRAITRGVSSVAVEEKFVTNGAIQGPVGGVAGIVREPLSRKRLRQPIEAFNDEGESEEGIGRTRNRKRSSSSAASRDLGEEVLVGTKRSRGPLFGSRQLELYRRPERQKQRTGEGDMMERLTKMKGKWSSSERTRKIVDASGFPVGWTVRVGLRYKDGRTLFEYRDWRSPDGTMWSSFKDASAFLLSSIGHESTSKIVVLVKPGRELIGDEGISTAKNENTSETIGKGNVQGEFCSSHVPRVALDQAVGGCSDVDKTPHSTRAAVGAEIPSYADKLEPEDCQREISNEEPTQESGQQRQPAFLLERNSCGDHMIKTDDLSKDVDLKEAPRISYRESTSGGMGSIVNSVHSKIKEEQCCTRLIASNDSSYKCPSCGMMFSTLLKLRGHLRRAKHGRQLKCDVCGKHFSSTASLLSHRVQMGHPRVTRTTSDSRRLQAKGLEPVSRLRDSKMFNIVLGLLSDTDGGIGCNVDHASVAAKSSSKSTENLRSRDVVKVVHKEVEQDTEKKYLRSRDVLKVVHKEVKQDTEKNGDLSGIFACETCNKVFYRRSQYWGHQSVHSKQRKKALKSSPLSESVSKRSLDTVVGSESNLAMVVRENCEYEAGNKYAVESVFWRLLDDSLPLERPNHELDPFQDEAVKSPALNAKEQVTSEIGLLTY